MGATWSFNGGCERHEHKLFVAPARMKLRGPVGPQGEQGEQGIQGPPGVGVTVETEGAFGFYINDSGHLMLVAAGNEVPNFSINSSGHLILILEEE